MEPAEIIREWSRRRRILDTVHTICAVGIFGTLIGAGVLDGLGVLDVPVWVRVAVVAAFIVLDMVFIHRVCRCPNCGRYPGVRMRTTASSRARRMVPFGWAVCLKCLVA